MTTEILGPFLFVDNVRDGRLHLAALMVMPEDMKLPPLEAKGRQYPFAGLLRYAGRCVQRARFTVPLDAPAAYSVLDRTYRLAGGLNGDVRIAFVSCNGQETGDLTRSDVDRNVMWVRLRNAHRAAPFALLLHGGDQIYADEATAGHPLSARWPARVPSSPSAEGLASLRTHLRGWFFDRYLAMLRNPAFAALAAEIPSLAQWDDHDICDGWGSLPPSRSISAVGRTLFAVAREMALLFQHGTVDGDLPGRFHDPQGAQFGWHVDFPGLRIAAPDLRSERTRRRIMGEDGWAMMERLAGMAVPDHFLLLSSVPLLGPRLSILEALMVAIPKMQHYEDDLRDQWQSRAHRAEWRRMLRLVQRIAAEGRCVVTVLSGEIHLATRATMAWPAGKPLQQLVASGVTHPAPPRLWARTLGALASLGEDPLPDQRITIHPIPGHKTRYVAERNTLALYRSSDAWTAVWSLEDSGDSAPLAL